MTEAVDGGIGVVITGTAIPTGESCVRTELDHAERHDRAGKRVTVSTCPDEGVDVSREISLARDRQTKQKQKKDRIYRIFQDDQD